MHKFGKGWINGVIALASLSGAGQSQAADKELLDILLGNGAITQAQYQQLLQQPELSKADAAVITVGNGSGLNIRSADGNNEFELGGRIHFDYVAHDYDARMGLAPVSGTQVRRGRVELNGKFEQHWAWAAEVDYAKNAVAIKDLKIGYITDTGSEVYVGSQKQPYSLSLEMSSNDEPFVERSVDNFLVAAFTDRALGIRGETSGEHWFVAAGLFGDAIKSGGAGKEGWGVSSRFVYTPLLQADKVLHLALRASYRELKPGSPPLAIKDRTSDFSELSIVNTYTMANAQSASLSGPEFAAAWGPLYLFGEYTQATITRRLDRTVDFDAWHVAATWSLTGESRAARYRMDDGEFKSIRPTRNVDVTSDAPGAWEVGLRYAALDLNDGSFVGGEESVGSLALNWYLNSNLRLMFDWTRILDTDGSNVIRRFAPGMNIYTLRSQYNF